MRRLFLIAIFLVGIGLTLSAQYQDRFKITWIEPGSGATLPESDSFDSVDGTSVFSMRPGP